MICQECKKKGLKSCIYPGVGSVTLVYYPPFYDEKGRFHNHDGNLRTTYYECSRGHKWMDKTIGSCWCGWPNKKGKEDGR